jgi:hypothetical protein
MANDLLLTHHHRDAMDNACERGFWMPLALSADQACCLTHLTAVSYSTEAIAVIAEITSLEPWNDADGIERWLPFMGRTVPLLRPVPLGDRGMLQGWLPRRREQLQLLSLDALLKAEQLSALLPGSGACCPWPGALPAEAVRADQAA